MYSVPVTIAGVYVANFVRYDLGVIACPIHTLFRSLCLVTRRWVTCNTEIDYSTTSTLAMETLEFHAFPRVIVNMHRR